jgi:hypothetical protein
VKPVAATEPSAATVTGLPEPETAPDTVVEHVSARVKPAAFASAGAAATTARATRTIRMSGLFMVSIPRQELI